MDVRTGFEEDEHFFGSYEAEPVDAGFLSAFEFDAESEFPSAAQRAHLTRFRKPVAWGMAALASLSLVALGHGLQSNSQSQLAAHSGSTIASPTSAAVAGTTQISSLPGSRSPARVAAL